MKYQKSNFKLRSSFLLCVSIVLLLFSAHSSWSQTIKVELGQPGAKAPVKQRVVPQKNPAQVEEQLLADRARRAEQSGDYARASQLWREVLNRNPWSLEAIDALARVWSIERKFASADSFLVSLISKSQFREGAAALRPGDPTSPFALTLKRGSVAYASGDSAQAWSFWNEALHSAGKNPETMRSFVTTLQQNRLWEESEKQIRDYRKEGKQDGFMALELANSLRSQMDFTAATEELLLYAESQEQNWHIALNYLQQFPDDSTIHPRVLGVLKKAAQQNKKSGPTWRMYAGYALKAGELETSLTATIAADSLTAGGGTLILANALALLEEGDVTLARRGFQKVIDLKAAPDVLARAELGLGRCLESLGKWGEAKAAYENFVKQHPSFKEVDEARFRTADIELNHERNAASALITFKGLAQRAQGIWKIPAGIKVGDCHAWLGEFDPAIAAWGDVVQMSGGVVSEEAGQALLKMARANFWRDSLNAAFKMLDSITAGNVGNTAFNDAINWTALLEEGGMYRAQRAFAEADYAGFKGEDSLAAARYSESVNLVKHGKLAEYCRYFEALSLRKAGAFRAAVAVLDSFATTFGESVDLDRAKYLRALIKMDDLREYAAAKTEFEQFLVDHPRSIYLEQARRKARILAARVSS